MTTVLAAAHVHSDWSYDGSWSLARIARLYARIGYRVVLTTEHDRGFDEDRRRRHADACRQASTPALLVVPGIEYSDPDNTVHLLVWGDVPFLGERRPSEAVLEEAAQHDAVVVLAHPTRKNAWGRMRPEWVPYLAGIEVWNRKTDGVAPSAHALELVREHGLPAFVGHDFHRLRHLFPLGLQLALPGPATEAGVVGALRTQSFRPTALGLDLEQFTTGAFRGAAARVERTRRLARSLKGRGPG